MLRFFGLDQGPIRPWQGWPCARFGSFRPALSPSTSLVSPPGFPPLPPSSRLWWRVRAFAAADGNASSWSAPASFTTGVVSWEGSQWVRGPRWDNLFRASFVLPVPVAAVSSALAHVAGLGVHTVSFNGAPPGKLGARRKLDGGWTSYTKRVLYSTHDVSASLVDGENVIGVALGNGWYGDAGWYKRPPYGWPSATNGGGFSFNAPPLLRAMLVVRLLNGSIFEIVTTSDASDGALFTATHGPVIFDSLYDGETFDGLRALHTRGWDAPGFSPEPGDWLPVTSAANKTINPALDAILMAQPFEPTMRLTNALPVDSWEAEPGVFVFDFGENGVGNVRWTFRGLPAGTNVTMRYAEVLLHPPCRPANTSLYFDNLRNAHATDFYTADGSGLDIYEPEFTWHGFRYTQVSGVPSPPALNDVVLVRQANGVTPGASVAFRSKIFGKISDMALNTIWSNLQGGPGSCGQRDERRFFTGDTAVSALTLMQHFRLRALMYSWILNGIDDQNQDGSIGHYLPTPIADQRNGSPQWSTGFLTVAWQLIRLEGDRMGCRTVYGSVKRYIDFNEGQYAAAVKQCGNLSCYWRDWPQEWQQLGPDPDPSCFNSFAYIHDLQKAGDIADGLGEAADAAVFRNRAAQRIAKFHGTFYKPSSSTYGSGTQSELSVALWLGAPPTPEIAAAVFASLLDTVDKAGGKQQAGIVGELLLRRACPLWPLGHRRSNLVGRHVSLLRLYGARRGQPRALEHAMGAMVRMEGRSHNVVPQPPHVRLLRHVSTARGLRRGAVGFRLCRWSARVAPWFGVAQRHAEFTTLRLRLDGHAARQGGGGVVHRRTSCGCTVASSPRLPRDAERDFPREPPCCSAVPHVWPPYS